MQKVIITGATGFIGGSLARYLLQKGITVYCVDISAERLEQLKQYGDCISIVASFDQYHELHQMITDADIDVFYHFAWGGVYRAAFKDYVLQLDNAKYSCLAFDEAMKIGCKKFVFAGTMNEYEMNKYINEDYIEPRYTYIYSSVKQVSEAICKTLAFNSAKPISFCSGRIAMAYGENSIAKVLPNVVMNNLINNLPSKLVEGNDLYDMIYIDDIVRAFEAIGENGKNMKSYYIGHRKIRTMKELILDMADAINPNAELLFGAYPDVPSGVDYKNIDTEALYNDTGFECKCDFKESIKKTADWMKKQKIFD